MLNVEDKLFEIASGIGRVETQLAAVSTKLDDHLAAHKSGVSWWKVVISALAGSGLVTGLVAWAKGH